MRKSSFGKHQKLNTPKLNIHILTENCQNIPTSKYPNLRYGVQCQVIYYICIYISSEYLSFSGLFEVVHKERLMHANYFVVEKVKLIETLAVLVTFH
jgi:hypothetical protein